MDCKARQKIRKADDDYYWPEPRLIEATIKQLKKSAGVYWADAATIQYGLALRPEEVPMLKVSNVIRNRRGRITALYVAPIIEGSVLIKDLKTQDSKASMPVTSETVRAALERRIKAGHRLLFPRKKDECGVRDARTWGRTRAKIESRAAKDPEFSKRTEYSRENFLWTGPMYCRQYLERLRAAAAEVKGMDTKRLDGRTFRRAKGRDIILATKSADAAATFLRDDVETVRSHYAKLLPRDIRVA